MAELIQIRTGRNPDTRRVALFDIGMRPFFLGAGLAAGLSLPWWLLVYAGVTSPAAGWPGHLQHAHEMVFGFGAAAVAGFLLTATANWTGRKPLHGAPVAALSLLWLAGRVAFYLPGVPPLLLAALDLAFLPALLAALAPAFLHGKRKNLTFAAWLFALSLANLACHLQMLGISSTGLTQGLHAGAYTLVMLVAILAGRVVPGFTQNALRLRGKPHETETDPRVDLAAKAACLCALTADVLALNGRVTGALAALAALLLSLRMRRWRTLQSFDQPIVWVLHVGHLWLVVGMALLAAVHFGAPIPATSPLHAFTTGVVGTMVLGIMTRASLGHTGRPLKVSSVITTAYLLVTVGALLRTFGPMLGPGAYRSAVLLGGSAWAAGYLLFTCVYTPILMRPRADGL